MSNNITNKIIGSSEYRRQAVRGNHGLFFHTYFASYVQYPTADFQKEMLRETNRDTTDSFVVVGFRGCAKSTIVTTSYPLWAVLGILQKKHILLVSRTQPQAKLLLKNIKTVVENNSLLRNDLGPFQEGQDEWRADTIVLPKFGARITAVSALSSIRGVRHGAHRPDLIICDDIEDLEGVSTLDKRDKLEQWVLGDLIPAGDKNTRFIMIGNMLHNDSILMRMKERIKKEMMSGIFRSYPLRLGETDKTTWPGKFPTMADAEKQKLQFGINEHAWQREYMLNIIPPDDQVVRPEWIEYYDHMPATHAETDFQYVQIGVDLAISEEDKADYTAMVPIMVYGDGEDVRLYVLPNIVNERLTSEKQFQAAMDFDITDGERHLNQYFLVEDVGYQKAFIQRLVAAGIEAEGITPKSRDKRERLTVAASLLEQGRVLFPRNGAKVLIDQLINFGTERYDDLADAFAYVLLDVIKTCMNGTVSVSMLEVENFNDRTYNENPFTNDKYRIAPRGEQGRLRAKFPGEFV